MRPQVSFQAELRRPDSFHVDLISYVVSVSSVSVLSTVDLVV